MRSLVWRWERSPVFIGAHEEDRVHHLDAFEDIGLVEIFALFVPDSLEPMLVHSFGVQLIWSGIKKPLLIDFGLLIDILSNLSLLTGLFFFNRFAFFLNFFQAFQLLLYRLTCASLNKKLLWPESLIPAGNQQRSNAYGERVEEQTTFGTVTVQNYDPWRVVNFLYHISRLTQSLHVLLQVIMWWIKVYSVLQSSQNLCLSNADLVLDFFHFLLIEGLKNHRHSVDYVVVWVTDLFKATVHVFEFGSQGKWSGKD